EQGLRRMLVRAVARIDDACVDPAARGQHLWSAGCSVPHDDRVGADRGERLSRVLQALALRDARALRGEVDDIRAQALGRGLEGDPRAGRVLEEEVDDGLAAECGKLLDLAGRD